MSIFLSNFHRLIYYLFLFKFIESRQHVVPSRLQISDDKIKFSTNNDNNNNNTTRSKKDSLKKRNLDARAFKND